MKTNLWPDVQVNFFRTQLGSYAVPCPLMDLNAAFSAAVNTALNTTLNPPFNPYLSDETFMIGVPSIVLLSHLLLPDLTAWGPSLLLAMVVKNCVATGHLYSGKCRAAEAWHCMNQLCTYWPPMWARPPMLEPLRC